MKVSASVKTQRPDNVAVEDGSQEDDLRSRSTQHFSLVGGAVDLVIPQYHQRHAATSLRIGAYDFEDGVLRLGPGNQKMVVLWTQIVFLDQAHGSRGYRICSVRDDCDLFGGSMSGKVPSNLGMICNQVIRHSRSGPLIQPKPYTRRQRPLLPLPLDTVHVHDIAHTAESVQKVENSGVVAKHQHDTVLTHRVPDSLPVKLHRSDGALSRRDQHTAYSIPGVLPHRFILCHLAIHRNFMVAGPQEKSKVLRERLKSAVLRRYTSSS